ncbi:FlgN protein [Anaerobacterium chartisolvens]|uniref:FlgN protein n=2 Tax=Anaerobacterium chartisolvens TaxID=1297424 RepID=A0A369B2W6_9FIRM|nr:FlgN protein [Anaerobacterium chartisolvens]
MTPEKYVDRLLELSSQKYKLLEEILLLTRQQAATIREDELKRLEDFIASKQEKIDSIDKIDEEFNVYFQRLKHQLKIKSLDQLKDHEIGGIRDLQAIVGKVMSIIAEISKLEKANGAQAQKLLSSLGDEIKKINQGKKMNSAYNPNPVFQPPSYFIDKKK